MFAAALLFLFSLLHACLAMAKVFVVGFPKMGTSSLFSYFQCGGRNASHWRCGSRLCAACLKENLAQDRYLFANCEYDVYAQLDAAEPADDLCFFPQVTHLDSLHAAAPSSDIVLNLRPTRSWIDSVKRWRDLHQRLSDPQCLAAMSIVREPNATGLLSDGELASLVLEQRDRVFRFSRKYGTHRLLMIDIESPAAAHLLHGQYGIDSSCWTQKNKNHKPKVDE